MKRLLTVVLLSFVILSMLSPVMAGDIIKESPLTTIKGDTLLFTTVDKTTTTAIVTKYDTTYTDRVNTYLSITVSDIEKKIIISDPINSVGATIYLPVKEVEAKLGSPPYGMNDVRYYPEKVTKDYVDYYVFKIPHFSTVDITDWQSSSHASRVSITVDSTALSGDVNNAIVVLKIADANCSGAITDGGDANDDFRFYSLNASGSGYGTTVTECDYDAFVWNTDSGGNIAIEVPFLDSAQDLVIYMYYDGDGDWDDISGTYADGKGIYHFEETSGTLTDWSGQGYTGTVSGADQTYTGYMGNCYDFDGSNDYVDLNDLDLQTAFTFVAWINADDTDGDMFIGKGPSNGAIANQNYAFETSSNKIRSRINGTYSDTSSSISSGVWYHIGAIWSGSSIQSYYNGSSNGSAGSIASAPNNNYDAGIGRCGEYNGMYFNGRLDEVWIFNANKGAYWISALYKSMTSSTTNFLTFGTAGAYPTFAITESPTNTTYSSPSSLDINVTITNGTGITFEEANFSYYDGSWHTIKNRVTSSDADKKTWTSSKIAWTWDDTNNFDELGAGDYNVSVDVFDGTTWYTKAISAKFTLQFNQAPNKPTITRIGLVDVNATKAYDEDTGNPTFSLSLKGYNSSDPDEDNQTFKWFIDDVFSELFTTPDYNTAYSSDINTSITTDIRDGIWYFGLRTTDGTETNSTFWKMTIDNRDPTKAVITSPTASSSTRDTTPAVTWTASTDGDGDDYNYCVVVKDGELNVDYNSGYKSTVTSPHNIADILDVDTYNVYVYTYDGFDANFSDGVEFSVIANSAPNTPTITSVGGVTDVNGTVYDEATGNNTYLLNLKGYNASDPDGDNMTHRWSWDTVYETLFTAPDNNSAWLDDPADINSSTITDPLARNTTIYIGLMSKDDYADANTSTFWKVMVENKTPTAGTLSTPADASETYDTTPELSWGVGTDDDGDTLTMQVKVYDASGNKDYNNTFGSATSVNATTLDLGTYTWRVRYYDGYDYTNSSDYTFTVIANTPPNKATIVTIGGVATGNDMYDEDTGAGFKLTMDGTNSSDYDGDAQQWAWIVDDDSGFGSINYNSSYVTPIDINWTTALEKNKTWYFRVDAIDPLGSGTANSSATFTGTMENYAPNAVTLSTPADLVTVYDTTQMLTWSLATPEDNDGDNVYYAVLVYDSGDALDYNSGFIDGATNANTTVLDLDTYTWKVVAYDNDGTYYYDKTNSSTTRTFTLIENTNPNKPTITTIGGETNASDPIYDEDSGAGFQITLHGYNSSDADGDLQNFKWDVDDNSTFSDPLFTVDTLGSADINRTMTTALTKNAYYWFRLGAIDPAGANDYNYSGAFYMYLANKPPTAGSLSTPTDASTTYDTTPTFQWGAGSDDDGDTLTMQVKVYDGEGNLDYNNTFGSNTSATPGSALDLGTYTWRVRYYDGYAYANSSDYTLTIIENTKPNAPTITSIGGQTGNATIYDENPGSGIQITVAGYNSSDPDGDNQTFKWEIDNDSGFGSITVTVTDIEAPVDINRAITDALAKNVDYYFRLGAIDPLGKNEYNYSATIFKMTFANKVPTAPVVTAPLGNVGGTLTPDITWTNSTDTDGDPLTYMVEISNASGVVRQSAWGVSQPYSNATALDYGDYNVTIYVYDTYDQNTSAVGSFTLVPNQKPNAPTITSVAGTSTNSTVYDQDAGTGTLWYLRGYNSSDPDGDNQTFKWEIDNNSNFGSPEYSATGLAMGDINRSMTTALNRNTSYYVRLGAKDPLGSNTYNYSQVLLLLFENYAPTAGSLTAPDDNSTTCDTTVFMSWGTGTDADGDSLTMQVRVYDSLGNKDYNNTFGADVNATTGVLTADTYTWKVVYYDGYDYTNSSTRTFTVVDNTVPSVPTLSTPANFAKDINPATVTLDWADSTDVCGDSITYTVQWSTSYTFTTYSEATSAVSTYAIPTELYTEQVYYWRVKATDVIGSTAWSSIYEFQTESSAGGSGSDQYELRMEGAYDKSSGRVEVTAWIQKNGQMVTGMSGVSIVMKDEANTTVHTFDDGTVYVDGFYKAVWTTTGLHGVYSLKGTATYSGNTYYGGSHFDAGIMEIFDALDSMETTINLIDDYVDTLETNVNATSTNVTTILGYVGTPADTSASNTLFGYSQYLKDKWGTQTADTIYNKVVDVYTIVNASNSTVTDIQSTLDDLDTYIRTYQGVEINVGSSYSFVDDQLEVTVAYVKDGTIQNTTSCTMLIKDTDGTTLKTFTDADDADNIYRYEWNSSAVDFPTNGFYGGYTIIPSVVYSGNTFSTVRTFSAEMPDLYGTTTYSSATTTYVDSGYSVSLTSAYTGSIIYVKLDSSDATLDLTNVTVTAWWEDSTSTVLATTSTTGTVSSGILRFSATIPSGANGASQLRVSAEKTVYGHRTTTLSGLATGLTITSAPVGSGLPPSITVLEIRNCPKSSTPGETIEITVLATKSRSYNTGAFTVALKDQYETFTQTNYELKFTKDTQDAVVKFKVPSGMEAGKYELAVLVAGRQKDSEVFEVVKRKGLFDGLFENGFEIRIPDTDIVIRLK